MFQYWLTLHDLYHIWVMIYIIAAFLQNIKGLLNWYFKISQHIFQQDHDCSHRIVDRVELCIVILLRMCLFILSDWNIAMSLIDLKFALTSLCKCRVRVNHFIIQQNIFHLLATSISYQTTLVSQFIYIALVLVWEYKN